MTSDVEREVVLKQNEWLREHYNTRTEHAGLFQKLRRCCICLKSSCGNPGPCRAEFEEWTKKRWDAAVDEELTNRGIGDPPDISFDTAEAVATA